MVTDTCKATCQSPSLAHQEKTMTDDWTPGSYGERLAICGFDSRKQSKGIEDEEETGVLTVATHEQTVILRMAELKSQAVTDTQLHKGFENEDNSIKRAAGKGKVPRKNKEQVCKDDKKLKGGYGSLKPATEEKTIKLGISKDDKDLKNRTWAKARLPAKNEPTKQYKEFLLSNKHLDEHGNVFSCSESPLQLPRKHASDKNTLNGMNEKTKRNLQLQREAGLAGVTRNEVQTPCMTEHSRSVGNIYQKRSLGSHLKESFDNLQFHCDNRSTNESERKSSEETSAKHLMTEPLLDGAYAGEKYQMEAQEKKQMLLTILKESRSLTEGDGTEHEETDVMSEMSGPSSLKFCSADSKDTEVDCEADGISPEDVVLELGKLPQESVEGHLMEGMDTREPSEHFVDQEVNGQNKGDEGNPSALKSKTLLPTTAVLEGKIACDELYAEAAPNAILQSIGIWPPPALMSLFDGVVLVLRMHSLGNKPFMEDSQEVDQRYPTGCGQESNGNEILSNQVSRPETKKPEKGWKMTSNIERRKLMKRRGKCGSVTNNTEHFSLDVHLADSAQKHDFSHDNPEPGECSRSLPCSISSCSQDSGGDGRSGNVQGNDGGGGTGSRRGSRDDNGSPGQHGRRSEDRDDNDEGEEHFGRKVSRDLEGNIPGNEFKAFKKKSQKHGDLKPSFEEGLQYVLAQKEDLRCVLVSPEHAEDGQTYPICKIQEEKRVAAIREINLCLIQTVQSPRNVGSCKLCSFLISVLCHALKCNDQVYSCNGCAQAITIVHQHICLCAVSNEYNATSEATSETVGDCPVAVCDAVPALGFRQEMVPIVLNNYIRNVIRRKLHHLNDARPVSELVPPFKNWCLPQAKPHSPCASSDQRVCLPFMPATVSDPPCVESSCSLKEVSFHLGRPNCAADAAPTGPRLPLVVCGPPESRDWAAVPVAEPMTDDQVMAEGREHATDKNIYPGIQMALPMNGHMSEIPEVATPVDNEGQPLWCSVDTLPMVVEQLAEDLSLSGSSSDNSCCTLIEHGFGKTCTSTASDVSLAGQEGFHSDAPGHPNYMHIPTGIEEEDGARRLWASDVRGAHPHVSYGTVTDVVALGNALEGQKVGQMGPGELQDKRTGAGVILLNQKGLVIKNGCYDRQQQWIHVMQLSRGIHGICFLAKDKTTNTQFVGKKIEWHNFAAIEVQVLSTLGHPNIVQFYGMLCQGPEVYLLMEYIDGGTLYELIRDEERIEWHQALEFHRTLLHALSYLKSKGIVHGDIKADNIMLRAYSLELVLIDFGLAKTLDPPSYRTEFGLPPTGNQVHWSPEKARSESYDCAVDVWASTCVLLHCLAGHLVWMKRFPDVKVLHFIIDSKSPPVEDIPDGLPLEVVDILRQGWTLNQWQRPTAEQLLQHAAFDLLSSNDGTCGHPEENDLIHEETDGAVGGTGPGDATARSDASSQLQNQGTHYQSMLDCDTSRGDVVDLAVRRPKKVPQDMTAEQRQQISSAIPGFGQMQSPSRLSLFQHLTDSRHCTKMYDPIPVLNPSARRQVQTQYCPADEIVAVHHSLRRSSGMAPRAQRSDRENDLPVVQAMIISENQKRKPKRVKFPKSPELMGDDVDCKMSDTSNESLPVIQTEPNEMIPGRLGPTAMLGTRNRAGETSLPDLPIFTEDKSERAEFQGARPKERFYETRPKWCGSDWSRASKEEDSDGQEQFLSCSETTQGSTPNDKSISTPASGRGSGPTSGQSPQVVNWGIENDIPGSVLTDTDTDTAAYYSVKSTTSSCYQSLLELMPESEGDGDAADEEIFHQTVAEIEHQVQNLNGQDTIGFMVRFTTMNQEVVHEAWLLELATRAWIHIVKMVAEKIHAAGFPCFTVVHLNGERIKLEEMLCIYASNGQQEIEVMVLPLDIDGSNSMQHGYEWQWKVMEGIIQLRDRRS